MLCRKEALPVRHTALYNPPRAAAIRPRFSPDGKIISFDSTHEGYRGIYTVDMDEIRAYLDTVDLT